MKKTYRLQTISQSEVCIGGDHSLILCWRFIKFISFIWVHDYPYQFFILYFYFGTVVLCTLILLLDLLFIIKYLLIDAEN